MPFTPKHPEALRLVKKYRDEYLSLKDSVQMVVELCKLGDEAQASLESLDTRRASLAVEIATLEEACQRWKESEVTERERRDVTARQAQEQTSVLASLDKQIVERSAKLEELTASMESLKKLVASHSA